MFNRLGCPFRCLTKQAKNVQGAYRWLSSQRSANTLPHLIKVVQGSSKDELANKPIYGNTSNRFGEDSWFVSSTPKAEVLGVADGVGGWRQLGVDAGAFAKELMYWCFNHAQQADFDGSNPRKLLTNSYNQLKLKSSNIWGSSTACLVTLNRNECVLHSANLGDSGFLVMRHGRVIHHSDEQVHDFNTPYQLTMPPNEKGRGALYDQPDAAIAMQMPLQRGDLIVVATDGLFDNVTESTLVRQLRSLHGVTNKATLQQAADGLVAMAKKLSQDANYKSPFSVKAKAHNVDYGVGGKPDDITLILASVEVPEKNEN